MILEYNKYTERQRAAELKEKFFELVLFFRSFYKQLGVSYIVGAGALYIPELSTHCFTGAKESRNFSIIDDGCIVVVEWQFTISLENNDNIGILFSSKATNEYTRVLEDIVKVYSYEIKKSTLGVGYYIKENEIENFKLGITNEIKQYVDAKKYNL